MESVLTVLIGAALVTALILLLSFLLSVLYKLYPIGKEKKLTNKQRIKQINNLIKEIKKIESQNKKYDDWLLTTHPWILDKIIFSIWHSEWVIPHDDFK